jgi:hypothetical protein
MPAITKPNLHFDAPIWTGVSTSSAITISSLNFQPDLVWGKNRTSGYTHGIHDSVRGTAAGRLQSNATTAEVAPGSFAYGSVSAFNSNGFTASPGSSTNENWNETSSNFVAWCWKAGGTAVTNTSGTISSQVSANPTAGFSVVTYTGNGTAGATIGHGLGVAPKMVILKVRNSTQDWIVGSVGMTSWAYAMRLNTTDAQNNTYNYWNSTTPSSTVVTLGDTGGVNSNGLTYVAYCWAAVPGYSAFGSYTGNGSTDGVFVYLGFRPRFVLFRSTSARNWVIRDTSRNTYNAVTNDLYPDSASSEYASGDAIDFLSNGFKLRATGATFNGSGETYIYAAFAEVPFKYSNGR